MIIHVSFCFVNLLLVFCFYFFFEDFLNLNVTLCITKILNKSSHSHSTLSNFHAFHAGLLPIELKALPSHVQDMHKQLSDFMEEHVYPNEAEFNRHQASEHCWTPHPLVEEIKVVLITVNK